VFILLVVSVSVIAHSGRTNSSGCHNDRKNGGYHCHNSKSAPSTPETIQKHVSHITSYNRKSWPHWVDSDHDCQNTRAEILIRDSNKPVKFKRNKGCNVTWGEWLDPYTLQTFTKASDIDIDHIIPLAHAHKYGAANWSKKQKRAFANDYDNLLAVEDNANQEKSAQAPHQWMPENIGYHCEYLRKWNHIKGKYNLGSSNQEKHFIAGKLKSCS